MHVVVWWYIFWRKLVILAPEWPFVLFGALLLIFTYLSKKSKYKLKYSTEQRQRTLTPLSLSLSLSLSLDKKKSKHIHPAALVFTLGRNYWFMLILKLKEALYNGKENVIDKTFDHYL